METRHTAVAVNKIIAWHFILACALVAIPLPIILLTGSIDRIFTDPFTAIETANVDFGTTYVHVYRVLTAAPEALEGLSFMIYQPWTPTIAAFIITAFFVRRGSAMDFLKRYLPYRGVGAAKAARVWILTITVFTLISLANAAIGMIVGGEAFAWSPPSLFSGEFLLIFLATLFLDGGGLAEEGGWRGLALPVLQAKYSPLTASIILGLIWAAWHIPVKVDIFFASLDFALAFYFFFFLYSVFFTIVITYFCNHVGGSALLAVVMHGMSNDAIGLKGAIDYEPEIDLGFFALEQTAYVTPMGAVAIFLIIFTKGRLGINEHAIAPWAQGNLK